MAGFGAVGKRHGVRKDQSSATVGLVQGGTMGSLVGYYRPADSKGFRITVWPITLWLLWVGGCKHPWLVEKTNHGALRFAVGINALYAVADLRMHEWSKLMALSNVSINSRSPLASITLSFSARA